ncbi:hypothetical protein [Pseudomonas sp. RIT-PI-AD]|nr:hypothetical protein [Pseudomonas sp. RIT-PI-AD]
MRAWIERGQAGAFEVGKRWGIVFGSPQRRKENQAPAAPVAGR